MANKAVIAGASGLIGSELLQILLQENFYDEVVALVRTELAISHKKLVQLVVTFDKLDEYQSFINGHALFCCLGSTKAKTPDLSAYYQIDHDYPITLAKIAKQNQIKHYHFVSSIGADAKSTNFYTKLKGETEDDLQQIGLTSLHLYRPSLLTGNRKESRFLEKAAAVAMKVIDPLLVGSLYQYRSIPATTVAQAMYNQSLNTDEGVFIHPSNHIKQLA
jgi:uncharacterized protein YbjT (DUF2867 family)